MRVEWIDSTPSTNSFIKENGTPAGIMICAREQTAGRGQRGNSWESEPGKNLTFSFLIENPSVRPAGQFSISEAVALAVVDVLDGFGITAEVKWPNDIYAGDRKIAGILIENSITGDVISRCIVGIGLNVNQTLFLSDAPNPVSMKKISGTEYSLPEVAGSLASAFGMIDLKDPGRVHARYMRSLWRADGRLHPFVEPSGERFMASIEEVETSGHIILKRSDGKFRRYAFKEVSFCII